MLLNENRNRIPEVDAAPVDNVDGGKVGDMKMVLSGSPATGAVVYVCIVEGVDDAGSPAAGGAVWKSFQLA